jgi:hypothetical protein
MMRRPIPIIFCLLAALALSGCWPGGGGISVPTHNSRATAPLLRTSLATNLTGPSDNAVTANAPFQAYLTVAVLPSSEDSVYNFWTHAEIDFDDGQGWQDITPQAVYFYKRNRDGAAAYVIKDFAPGDYNVRSRATYNDGEVLEGGPLRIIVAP